MPSNLIEYEEKWNKISWEFSPAIDSFYSLLAISEWQQNFITQAADGETVSMDTTPAIFAISNALHTEFFISACRIREESRTSYNIYMLFKDAKRLQIINCSLIEEIDVLLTKTSTVFKKIKKIRGMAVAHLLNPQNAIVALKKEGIEREDIICYLEDCSEIYKVLGTPFNKEWDYDIRNNGQRISKSFRLLFSRASC